MGVYENKRGEKQMSECKYSKEELEQIAYAFHVVYQMEAERQGA